MKWHHTDGMNGIYPPYTVPGEEQKIKNNKRMIQRERKVTYEMTNWILKRKDPTK